MRAILIVAVSFLAIACGGGGGGGSPQQTGSLSLAFTDAAADEVFEVHIVVSGVTLKRRGTGQQEILFDTPVQLDLASLVDGVTASVLTREEVPAGEYEWIRFHVEAEHDTVYDDGYVMTAAGMEELEVPSNRLRLVSGFTVLANQTTDFVIDWDLRKGLTNPVGQDGWFLKPAWRIVDMTEHGSIVGSVAEANFNVADPVDEACSSELDAGNVVYVFSGDVMPDDIDDPDEMNPDNVEPLTTAVVRQRNNGSFGYESHFLPPGEYTVAFTCQALDDEPDTDDAIHFVMPMAASVVADQETVVDF